jgi:hypothetical protein
MYNYFLRLVVLALVPLLFGCAQPKRQAIVFPARAISPAGQAAKGAPLPAAPIGALRNVRQAESVKVYGINRYVDPSDPNVLHERHAIYRIEQQPSWITQTNRNQSGILLGPVVGLRNLHYAPEPLPGETARDLAQTKQALQEANHDIHAVQENQEKLAGTVQSLAEQTVDAQRKLGVVVSALNGRLQKLEGKGEEMSNGANDARQRKVPADDGVVIRKEE